MLDQQWGHMTIVVIEYATARLIDMICHELEIGRWNRFGSHALLKAQSKEYVRESQVRLILAPIAEWMAACLGQAGLERRLQISLAPTPA
jgi:hypothetical protein